jgi:arylsulfatase A-like enzyme
MPDRNVVLFITDGHRRDTLGCYGNDLLETPNIDAFAEQGARFDRAFCTHSVCMPTRASVYTGRYPHVHGVWANGVTLPACEVTMPETLGEAGYTSCASGKIHFEPQQQYSPPAEPGHVDFTPGRSHTGLVPIIDGDYYGFDEVHICENKLGEEYVRFIDERYPELSETARGRVNMPEEAHELTWITDQAIDFVSRRAQADAPFFCHCSYHELSPPCTPPLEYAGHYDPADVPIPELREDDLDGRPWYYRACYEGYLAKGRQPDEETLRRYIASYYDQMRFLDHQFGRLLAALDEAGVADNTIVLFVADHGLSLNDHYQWRHGPFLFDQVTNIPMIWRVPGAPNLTTDEFVEQVDIMPTVLDLCGVDCPAGVQGRSIAPLLRGQEGVCGRDSVLLQEREAPDLSARGLEPDDVNQWAVRTHEWKLIHYPGEDYGELYDLRSDPGEFVNLWSDEGYRTQRREMEHLLMERILGAQDPLPERHYEW